MAQTDYIEADNILRNYKLALADIHNNVNLDYWTAEVNLSISFIVESIAKAQNEQTATTYLEVLLNEFYYLKYQLAERT